MTNTNARIVGPDTLVQRDAPPRGRSASIQLREIMRERVVTIGPGESASAAWTRMRRRDIRHLVVTDAGRLVGVLSERDLGGRSGGDLRKGRRVQDLMSRRVLSAEPDATLHEAADLMRERLIGALPVVEGDRLVGIVTATDVFDSLESDEFGPLSRAEQGLLRAPTSSKTLGGRVARSRAKASSQASRGRRRPSQSEKRAPFADQVPRQAKRVAGRTTGPDVPANIRVAGVNLNDHDRDFIREKLGAKLGKFATDIERVSVRVEDVNGPRGGVDQSCRIKVVMSGLPSIVFENQAADLGDAIHGALSGVARRVRRTLARRQTKPIKAANSERMVRGG